ncbi:MAG: hypothetical protein V4713_03775 [Pseudomonadota bacterium]
MKLKIVFILAILLALTACGEKLEGAYSGNHVGTVLTFKPNGKVVYMGMSELDYEADGKEIKIHMPDKQVMVLKVLDNGSIQFPLLGKLTKVSS